MSLIKLRCSIPYPLKFQCDPINRVEPSHIRNCAGYFLRTCPHIRQLALRNPGKVFLDRRKGARRGFVSGSSERGLSTRESPVSSPLPDTHRRCLIIGLYITAVIQSELGRIVSVHSKPCVSECLRINR